MTPIRTASIALLTLATITISAGCSRTDDITQHPTGPTPSTASSAETRSPRPTLTNPKLQPPSQDNKYTASTGRPKVIFDPCTWISDDTIEKAGFDPTTRKRGDDLVAEYSFLTCDFHSPERTLMLNSGNATWQENLAKVGSYSEPTTVNGREGLLVRDPAMPRDCQVDVRTKVGFLQIVGLLTDRVPRSTDPCNGIQDIASAIEPEIGKDN